MSQLSHRQRIAHIRNLGSTAIEYISELSVWLMPIVASLSLFSEMTHRQNSLVSSGLGGTLAAVAVELCALSFMHTALSLFNQERLVPFGLMLAAIVVYILTIATVTIGHFMWPELARTFTPIALSIIALLSALCASFRANYLSGDEPVTASPVDPGVTLDPGQKQAVEPVPVNLNRVDEVPQSPEPTHHQAAQLRAKGLIWSRIADELGVSLSTAKRWARSAELVDEPAGSTAYVNGSEPQ